MHAFPDLQKLIAIFFLQTTGIKLEALDSESALEEAWISNNEIIGVVFKDNFSYHLRFPTENVAIPNENFGYIGNKNKNLWVGDCLACIGMALLE